MKTFTAPEEWRPVLDGNYAVSSYGRVRRAAGRRIGLVLKTRDNNGYRIFSPVVAGRSRTVFVHVLVAAAFIGPKPPGHDVNHIDGDKANNCPSNLEYLTPLANHQHAARTGLKASGARHGWAKHPDAVPRGEQIGISRLTREAVVEIRARAAAGESLAGLGRAFGVQETTIGAAVRRQTWRHVP